MDKLEVIEALAALAQENRLDIFRILIEKNPKGMMVGEIGEALKLPHATLSFHLDKLKQVKLINSRKDGRATIYTADYSPLIESIRYLTKNCCKSKGIKCHIEIKHIEDK